jgi:hypothetical protein
MEIDCSYRKSMVAMWKSLDVTGSLGAREVYGGNQKSWLALRDTGCFRKSVVAMEVTG